MTTSIVLDPRTRRVVALDLPFAASPVGYVGRIEHFNLSDNCQPPSGGEFS